MTATWPPSAAPGQIALSVVIPVFNEVESIPRLVSELLPKIDHASIEVILVDDGSTDGTPEAARQCSRFEILSLPRSGKTEALRRGVEAARGEWILTLDGDLQEDPADIAEFWNSRDGLDALFGVRSRRHDPLIGKRAPSHLFNAAVRSLFGVSLRDINCGFRLMRRSALEKLDWFRGAHRFLPLMLALRGARVGQRPVTHRARQAGKSKFNSIFRGPEALAGIAHLLREGAPSPASPRRIPKAALILALAAWGAISTEAALRSRTMWPLRSGDELAFIPPMLSFAQGRGLVNDIRPVDLERDPSGLKRFVSHGFLNAMVVGSLSRPSYRSVEATIAGLAIAALGLSALLFCRVLSPSARGPALVLPAAGVAALSTPLFGLLGRPEPFAMLLLAGGAMCLSLSPRHRAAICGVFLGLLGCAHPIAFILALLLVTVAVFLEYPPGRSILILAVSGFTAVLTAVPLFLWFPYDLRGWIRGNLSHAQAAVFGKTPSPFAEGWLLNSYCFAAAPIFLLAALWALSSAVGRIRRARPNGFRGPSRVLSAASLLALAWAFWYLGVRVAWRSYDVLLLSPIVIAFLVFEASRLSVKRSRSSPALLAAFLLALSFSGGFLRTSAVRWVGQRASIPYGEARERLARLRAESLPPILISPGCFELLEDARGLLLSTHQTTRPLPGERLFLQQAFSGRREPPEVPGFSLVEDRFLRLEPRLFGVRLSRNIPGYNYAIYVAR